MHILSKKLLIERKNLEILFIYFNDSQANNQFQIDKFIEATNLYNIALGYCPTAAVLYGNRAAALMKRRWDGDIYAAIRDCQTTLLLDPDHVKAHFRCTSNSIY